MVGRSGRLHRLTDLSDLSFVWISLRSPRDKYTRIVASRFLPG